MQKWQEILIVGIVFAASVGYAQVTAVDKYAKTPHQGRVPVQIIGPVTQTACEVGQCETRVKMVLSPPHWWLSPEWWVVIVAAVTGGFICWQSFETRSAAQGQVRASRAWVLASVHGQPEEPLTGNLFKGIVPGVVWRIAIFGNTPARIIREEYRCRIVAQDPDDPSQPMLEHSPLYFPDYITRKGGAVSPPGDATFISLEVEFDSTETLMKHLSLVAIRQCFLCSYGRIEYEDAFGSKSVTQFCAIYEPQLGGVVKSPDGIVLNPRGFRIDGPSAYNFNT